MMTLSKYLTEKKVTDEALATKVGCDRSMISKLKAGKATPSLRLAVAISRETGVPVEALLPPENKTGAAA